MGIFDKLFGKKSKKVVPEKRPSELASEAYTNKELGFSITPPKGWNIHESDFGIVVISLRGSVVFYAPMGKEVKEVGDLDVLLSEGVPHIKIIVMETEMTLDEVDEKNGVSIIQLDNRKIESKRKRTINDLDAYEYVSTLGSEIEDITFCKSKDLAIVEKGLAYSITFIVKEEDYDRYLPVFEESIQTFQVGEPVTVELPFIQALKDKDKNVRKQAVVDLGMIRDPRAVKPLIKAMKDEDKDVRSMAIVALGNIGKPAVEPLIQALKDEDDLFRKGVIMSLAAIGKPAIESLSFALMDEDKNVRKQAAMSLGAMTLGITMGGIEPAEVADPLIQVLKDEDKDVRTEAIGGLAALALMVGKPVVELLIQALKNKDPLIQEGAKNVLEMNKSVDQLRKERDKNV